MGERFFKELPSEIVDDILTRVRSSDVQAFHALRISSKACKKATDFRAYRQITLANTKDPASKHARFQRYKTGWAPDRKVRRRRTHLMHKIIKLLLDPDENVAAFVRDLTIGPFKEPRFSSEESQCPFEEQALTSVLLRLENLRDFRWHTSCRMPTAVLELLTGKLSNCRVHIAQTTCRIARLDEQMLKLPNMYRIDLTVLNGSYPPISEFPILDRILPDASRLQHLSLKPIECDGWAGRKEFERLGVESEEMHGPLHLATPLVRCQLRSLTLSGHIFMDYWPQTLLPWMSAMDWTQLRHLNLADAAHRAIIVDLTGRVPRLESLRLGHPDNTDAYTFPADLHYLKAFLTAAQELRSVSLVNWPASDFEHLLDTVLACLGPNLHSFGVIPSRRVLNRFLWNAAQLKKCCAMAPNLRELTVELDPNCQHAPLCMNLTEQTTYDESWLLNLYDSLLPARNLSTLLLSIELLHLSSSEEYLAFNSYNHGLNQVFADRIIRKIFESAVHSKPYSPLTFVEVTIRIAGVKGLQWRIRARRQLFPLSPEAVVFSTEVSYRPRIEDSDRVRGIEDPFG